MCNKIILQGSYMYRIMYPINKPEVNIPAAEVIMRKSIVIAQKTPLPICSFSFSLMQPPILFDQDMNNVGNKNTARIPLEMA